MSVLMLIGALKGLSRGISRQAIRTLTVVVAVIAALGITKAFAASFYSDFANMTPDEFVYTLEDAGIQVFGTDLEPILANVSPETVSYILAIPLSLIILPVIFVITFIVLKLLLLIVHAILCGVFKLSKDKNNFLTRLLGAILGAVQGIACAVIITMPIVGIANTATNVVNDLREKSDNKDVVQLADDFYDSLSIVTDSGMVKFFGGIGGNALYNQFTTVTIEENTFNIPEEVAEPLVQIIGASDKLTDFDWKNLSKESKDGIFIIVDAIDGSTYFKKITLDILELATDAYFDGALDMEADALLIEVVDSAFTVIGNIDENSFKSDIMTIFDTYAILGREGALSAFETGQLEEVRTVLTADYEYVDGDPITSSNESGNKVTVLKKVTEILNENAHTRPLVTALSRISVSVLAQSFGSELETEQIYSTVKTGLNSTLQITKEGKSEEEYKAEVKESLNTALMEVEIELEDAVLDEMANYVNENYETLADIDGNGDGVTDDEINEIILSYYDAYVAAGGDPDQLPGELPDNLPENFPDLGGSDEADEPEAEPEASN